MTAALKPPSTIYPLHPKDTKVLLRVSGHDITLLDRLIVGGSSLAFIGSVIWVPFGVAWAYRRWKQVEDPKRKRLYAILSMVGIALVVAGPHRAVRVGNWMGVRRWRLWTSWIKFIALTVIAEKDSIDLAQSDRRAILAFCPHGIFPFGIAFGALPEYVQQAFGKFRPVVATATGLFPFVRDFIKWAGAIDASRASVESVLSQTNHRIGLVPGGIAEIFEGYPKEGTHPDEEYSILRRGFLRLASQYNLPVVPIYCFGATKMFHRLDMPILEYLSKLFRISVCIFFGQFGLPIPFRQQLMYVIGKPIQPSEDTAKMQRDFADELVRIFDRHKEAYGWGAKTLKVLLK